VCIAAPGAVRSARLTGSRSLTRGGHRPPAIERDLFEQAAMFILPMSALHRITDSSRTASHVRKVPKRKSSLHSITSSATRHGSDVGSQHAETNKFCFKVAYFESASSAFDP
jgi:hypothetical protein